MKLSQKKNCNGCKALDHNRFSASCRLGFKPVAGKSIPGLTLDFVPNKPCYKPMTNNLYFEAKNLICSLKDE